MHGRTLWPRAQCLGLSAALCVLSGACGSDNPSAPATPGPTPSTTSRAASLGHLHVVQGVFATTYEIDAAGRLRPPVTQNIGAVRAVTNDPSGRLVYAAFGGWRPGDPGPADQTVAAFGAAEDGTLRLVSERTLWRRDARVWNDQDGGEWKWISAGASRLHGLRLGTNWRHVTYYYASVPVTASGELGAPVIRQFDLDEDAAAQLLVDVSSDLLYMPTSWRHGNNGLVAHSIGADGALTQTGWSDLCLGSTVVEPATPLVAARGLLLADVRLARQSQALCSYEGARLAPRALLDFVGQKPAAAFVPTAVGSPALIAMSVSPSELRLLRPRGDGSLEMLDQQQLPSAARTIVFHPSGRFLYVSDAGTTLLGFAIDSDGRLSLLDTLPHAGGALAVTAPPTATGP